MLDLRHQYQIIDKQDFRHDRSQLIFSYVFRMIAAIIFGALLYKYVGFIHEEADMKMLLNIELSNVPGVVSVILLVLDLILVLYIHELIHAGVYFSLRDQKPVIGIRGLIIFAAAPSQVISRKEILINAVAPLLLISTVGLVTMLFMPLRYISWIFIPTLANAAASAGDLMTIYFVMKQKAEVEFNDVGDIIYALKAEH